MTNTDLFYGITIAIATSVWVYHDAVIHQRRRLWAVGTLVNAPVFFPLYFWSRPPEFFWSCPRCYRINRRWTRRCPRCETVVAAVDLESRLYGFWSEADAVAIFLLAQALVLPLPWLLGLDLKSPNLLEPSRFWLIQMIYVNIVLALSFFCVTGRYRRSLREIGLRLDGLRRWIPLGVIVGVGLIFLQNAITTLMVWIAQRIGIDLMEPFQQEMLSQRQGWPTSPRDPLMILVIFVVGFLVPFSEEVLVRGIGYQAVRARIGPGSGMIVTSLVFAFLHQEPLFLPALFAVGWVLNFLFERSRSLVPSIVAHATLNLIVILAGLSVPQPTGGS